ncbi:MAG: HAD-IIB family hydrolase, partial [Candidatus Omnitrophica bacterium]|nr:HAD-IIB family hydrolase [Candidatus Omnitrophota bacterium]
LLVLGIGRNGHLAFHEPGFLTDKLVDIVNLTPETKSDNGVEFSQAFTLTLKTILKAKEIILLASGEHKRDIIEKALLGEVSLNVPASFLQNHNRTSFLIDQGATKEALLRVLKAKLKEAITKHLGDSSIKVFASDLDFTLSPLGEHLRKPVIEKLKQLAKKGIHIAIITGASYSRIKEEFLDYLPQDFPWQYLHIYSNVGAGGYGFDSSGQRITYYEVKLFPEQWEKLREVVKEFKEEFKEDFEGFRETEEMKGTIVLKDRLRTKETYEKYLTFLEERLKNTGLIINGTGHLGTIDITYADKSYALINLRERLDILSENMVYVGDTFAGKFANDLPAMILGVWIFNVGSIDNLPKGIFSLGIRGDLGTEILLEVLLEKK